MGANGAEGRNRTGTVITHRRILSPVRLPVPPPRHVTVCCNHKVWHSPYESGRRGSNPRPPPWQGDVLPLNYFREWCRLKDSNPRPSDYKSDALPTELSRRIQLMRVKGLEPPHLAALDPDSSASANSATPANELCRARTCDPLIKSQMLYQLS